MIDSLEIRKGTDGWWTAVGYINATPITIYYRESPSVLQARHDIWQAYEGRR